MHFAPQRLLCCFYGPLVCHQTLSINVVTIDKTGIDMQKVRPTDADDFGTDYSWPVPLPPPEDYLPAGGVANAKVDS